MRNWRQRLDPDGNLVFRRPTQWGDTEYAVGDAIPDDLRQNRKKLRMLWESERIELADYEQPPGAMPRPPYEPNFGEWEGRGQLFSAVDDEFWQYGIGAMAWFNEQESLFVVVPSDSERGFEGILLYSQHAPGNWAEFGDEVGWDGNIEEPTFKPSIASGEWHGFIVDGKLSAKGKDDDAQEEEEQEKG